MIRLLLIPLLVVLALPVSAQQALVFHPEQWQAVTHEDRTGQWQTVLGPATWLVDRLEYDPQMKLWEVREGGFLSGWGLELNSTPVYDGDTLTIDDKGVVRIKNL